MANSFAVADITIKVDVKVAQDMLSDWQARAVGLEAELDDLNERIASVKAQLAGSYPKSPSQALGNTSQAIPDAPNPHREGKRPKGENFRIIREYLSAAGTNGATVAAIHAATGIGLSSIQVVLKRHSEVFGRNASGLWTARK